MPVLSSNEITQSLTALPEWKLEDGNIVRTCTFTDFLKAISFVDNVAILAEQAGHHPDIDIRYNKVKLSLSSHDAGGITEKDFALATAIGKIV